MTDDLISRAEAIEEIEFGITNMKAINIETGEVIEPFAKINAELREAVNRVKELPSAQPKTEGFEWCHDCKEYDQEGHCCHRWTKVIRKTVDEIKAEQSEPNWIPCSKKLPKRTDLYYVTIRDEKNDIEYTSCMNFYVNLALWEVDVNVIAWMPLPEPYKPYEVE